MRIRINNGLYANKYFQVDEGATYTMNYNETLDSASIRISHLTEELDIEPFDEIILETDAFTRYMCVDSYSTMQEGLDTPTYVYNITLVSQTKLLENIVLPNISITPRKIGKKLSIADYLEQYLNEYANYKNWRFKGGFKNVFSNDCPELQWNMPTLREVFNTLMMVKDKIPVLENGVIGWLDLTERKGEVSGDINYIQKSQSADNYVSEIRMQMQNVLQTNVEGVNNTCNTYENMTFTTNDYVATTENVFLKTKFPILNIKHLWLTCYYNDTDEKVVSFKVDLCNLDGDNATIVYESKEYDVLPVLYRTLNIGMNGTFVENTVKDYFSKYKNYCIYYTRGNNRILGFTDIQKGVILNFTNQTYEWIKALAFSRAEKNSDDYIYNSINNGYAPININNGFFNAFFQIEYETSIASVFSASKENNKVRNQRVVIDNQTNSWVEASSQGFLEYQKANRMGNQQLLINQRSKYPQHESSLIRIGQTYRDSIVYKTQYQIYKHHIEVNAYATKNYILQNYFTGIKSKIRTWVNAQNEAFVRNELIKRYCVFSLENKNTSDFDSYFLSPFNSQGDKSIKYAVVRTSETNNDKYLLDVISRAIGKSIVFTTGFDDNWVVGKHVNVGSHATGEEAYEDGIISTNDIEKGRYDLDEKVTYCPSIEGSAVLPVVGTIIDNCVNKSFGGIPFNHYKYVDDNGEYTSVGIQLINSYQAIPLSNTYKQLIYRSYAKPLIPPIEVYTARISELNIELHKDNKEIPMFNLQYEFMSDNENIVITEYFARYQEAVRTKIPQFNYYYNTTFNRSAKNMKDFSGYRKTAGSISTISNRVIIEAERPQDTILYVCDEEQNIILMLNTNETSIYLNVSDRRI